MQRVDQDKYVESIRNLLADKSKNRVWIVRENLVYCAWSEGENECSIIEFEHEVALPEVDAMLRPAEF